ncbi:MAG: tetratricopeptide repeat protein [Nitrospira sp.]
MIRWQLSTGQLHVGIIFVVYLASGCVSSKDTTTQAHDMAEYRTVMDAQKAAVQGSLEDSTSAIPEMTAEEHERAGDMDVQRRNFPLASVHYSKSLQAQPSRDTVRLKLGQIFLQQGMLNPALTRFQELVTRIPHSAEGYQGIGHVFLMQGKLQESEDALKKSLTLVPGNWQTHNFLGLVYDQMKRHDEAITSYKAALALHPGEPGLLNNLGLAYALSGDHDAAIQTYEQALTAGSASPKLHNNLGVAYAHRQRYADALNSFKKATDEPRAYNNLGVVLFSLGNPKQAAVCFEKALEVHPQYYEKAADNLHQIRQALAHTSNGDPGLSSTEGLTCP